MLLCSMLEINDVVLYCIVFIFIKYTGYIYINGVEHTVKITVLQCCPVQYKVELCNTK